MQAVSVRYPEEHQAYVRRIAKQRGVNESDVWRELVRKGFEGSASMNQITELTLKASIQSLTLSRRLAGHFDETLVTNAKQDAEQLIARTMEDL